jgi:hypothetical protein
MATAISGLAKATLLNRVTNDRIEVMYNPEEYKLEQGNDFAQVGIPGLDAPPVQYVRGKGRTLSMDLFFDTYEANPPADVRTFSGKIVRLLDKHPRTHAPPVLLFAMGQFTFECVLTDVSQRYTMFQRDGTPVRATLSVRFQEFVRVDVEIQSGLFIGPPILQNAIAGQTISHIAGDVLGDPRRWREVAEPNGIDDPMRIPAGTPIVIPSSTP